jgi:hypothetical protein
MRLAAHPRGQDLQWRQARLRGEEIFSRAPATGAVPVANRREAVHVVRAARRAMIEVVASDHVLPVSCGGLGKIVVPSQAPKPVRTPFVVVEAEDRSHQVRHVLSHAVRACAPTCRGHRARRALCACGSGESRGQGEDDGAEREKLISEEAKSFHTLCFGVAEDREHPLTGGAGWGIFGSPRCIRAPAWAQAQSWTPFAGAYGVLGGCWARISTPTPASGRYQPSRLPSGSK